MTKLPNPRTVTLFARSGRRSAALAGLLAFSPLAAAQDGDRIAVRVVDEASATVHAVVSEHLDLGVRTARLEGDLAEPRVPLAPPMVVGQGEDRSSLTVVRVLNRYQVTEAQFLAFDASVRGGVRVAAGRDAAGATRIAATPAAPQTDAVVRVFNAAGGLQAELTPDVPGFGRGSLHVRIGDFFPDRPGDELAAVAGDARPMRVLWFGLDGEALGDRELDLPARQELSVSVDRGAARKGGGVDRLRVHTKPAHDVLLFGPGEAEPERMSFADLPPNARVWPSWFGPRKLIAGVDEALQSHLLRLQPGGGSNTLDVGNLENQFWIAGRSWAPEKAKEASRGNDDYIKVAEVYQHIRTDAGSLEFVAPEQWDEPGIWPKIKEASEEKWSRFLKPLNEQPLRFWEPCMTHRMHWDRGLPWAERVDAGTGKPRFLSLSREDQTHDYGEFGVENQFHIFTYGYGDVALDQLYQVPLQQLLLRMAPVFRDHPERVISLEPVHEHEISVGEAGSVGDYHALMIAGFHGYLNGLYGDDAQLGRVFGLPGGAFDPPRNKGRGAWDAYDLRNPFYAQWILYQRHVVNRRIADGFTYALAAGYPPEIVKGHQIPDTFAVGSTETFSDRKSRITPVDYTLQAGVGFGYTRYGVFFKRPENMLKSAESSGFQSIVMGEYQALTPDAGLAAEQLDHVFDHGVTAIHAMKWPESADKGYNDTMKAAVQGMLQKQRPRPGLAGGVGRNVPLIDREVDVAVIGTGSSRTGLLKSLDGFGRWEGSVYCVPFRSRIDANEIRDRIEREGGAARHRFEARDFDGASQVEVTFRGRGTADSAPVRFTVERDGVALPGLTAEVPAGTNARDYRFVLRNQLPAEGLELVVGLPAGFETEGDPEAQLLVDQLARPHRGVMLGVGHRGSIDFDVMPIIGEATP